MASLYSARQRYEDTLAQTSAPTAAANLTSAGIVEAEVLRDAGGSDRPRGAAPRPLPPRPPPSRPSWPARPDRSALVTEQIARRPGRGGWPPPAARQRRARGGPLSARRRSLQAAGPPAGAPAPARSRRGRVRAARSRWWSAGLLALVGALALITALVSSMRRPLDALVDATQGLAAGELDRRVDPPGPRELQELGSAFNAMGEELANAQARIEEERRRLAVTIESLGDALIVTEPGSNMIATVNPRAAELVPELASATGSTPPSSPLPPLDAALARETTIEHRGRIARGHRRAARRATDGVVWTVRDMTERARLERAKSEFVATASHELRSPLTSIKGFVELLERSPENMSERQREFVEIILRSTDRLVELVNDLLDVARIEADRVEINRRPIDVGEAVREVAELMGPRIDAKHQQLGVYVAARRCRSRSPTRAASARSSPTC